MTSEYAERRTCITVQMFWHETGLTLNDAQRMREELEEKGVQAIVKQHRDPNSPDAVFIGALVNAEDARTVLARIPYKIEYIFPLDYPRGQGGDPDGLLIGIGYMSTHAQDKRTSKSTPVRVTEADVASLLEADLSNTDFQLRLRGILSSR